MNSENIKLNNAKVIWFTGLSGSGKTTIAKALKEKLFSKNIAVVLLDGDIIREGLNKDLGFSLEDRKENIRRVAEVAKLFKDAGVTTIVSFISPTNEIRKMAKDIISVNDFIEIFVDTPLELCMERDVKGLYKKAIAGEIDNFTGISSPYEKPEKPNLTVDTGKKSIKKSVKIIMDYLFLKQKYYE